jgi:hypothetical protein
MGDRHMVKFEMGVSAPASRRSLWTKKKDLVRMPSSIDSRSYLSVGA